MDYESLLKNSPPLEPLKSNRSVDSQDETNYINTSYINTSDSIIENKYIEQRDNLLVKDNSWKRFFFIKYKILCNFFVGMTPVTYFMLISYVGSNLGGKFFKGSIKPILEKTIN